MPARNQSQRATEPVEQRNVPQPKPKKNQDLSEDRPKLMLAQLRQAKGLTQLEVANKLGVRESTFASWEKGREGSEAFFRIRRLCQFLDCSFEELFDDLETQK